jgi:hypothetical protein
MNRLRCFLIAAIVALSSATFALGGIIQTPGKSGDIQAPGKSEPLPPSPASASATSSTTDAWQDLTTVMLRELLVTIY